MSASPILSSDDLSSDSDNDDVDQVSEKDVCASLNQKEINKLKAQLQLLERNTKSIQEKTQFLGQYDLDVRRRFLCLMYVWFSLQFLFSGILIWLWIYHFNLQEVFVNNPILVGWSLVLVTVILLFYFFGFHSWNMLTLFLTNVLFSVLVSTGMIYSDSTFLLECMIGIWCFAVFLIILNAQQKVSYSPGIIVCIIVLVFLISTWHFVYEPHRNTLYSVRSFLGTGYHIERLFFLIFTIAACCAYILVYEEEVKKQYLIDQHVTASIYLYIRILFFVYVLGQLLHWWSIKLRRCRRGAYAFTE